MYLKFLGFPLTKVMPLSQQNEKITGTYAIGM